MYPAIYGNEKETGLKLDDDDHERKAVHDASHRAAEDVMKVWAKASILACLK